MWYKRNALHILKCLFLKVSKLHCFFMDSNCLNLPCSQQTEGTEQTTLNEAERTKQTTLAEAQAHS